MKRFGLALRTFFRLLGDGAFAEAVQKLSTTKGLPAPVDPATRSDALTLLATLQREARLLDFVLEPLDGFDDAQVGAAARDVHRDTRAVVERIFAPVALRTEDEGSEVVVPATADPSAFKLTGPVSGEPPYRGVLQHHGWKATACNMPTWTGDAKVAMALAPAEVELG